jgi:uncharacterized membrane protein YfcA
MAAPSVDLGTFLIGVVIGFMGGLFGKGGSAVATPLLALIGVPGFVAVAAPLPAVIPGTFLASVAYWRERLLDWPVVLWSIGLGTPATIAGALLSTRTGARPLLVLTAVLVLGFGMAFLMSPQEEAGGAGAAPAADAGRPSFWVLRLGVVTVGVGVVSGLLANSGGFLLAPCYARFLKMPLKKAFACSLAVSMVLAIPGAAAHWWLGHIQWGVVLWLGLGSIPFSYLGARVAVKARSAALERAYGLALTALGAYSLFRF